ncbi:hypothetical protein ACTJKO_00615 [Curtobacterium sp. 22159]|uniref:hypothetical protein n=1 Tax=Curtobacterium sp. 22159 TaxID=3453882 RepID=UPI003F86380F
MEPQPIAVDRAATFSHLVTTVTELFTGAPGTSAAHLKSVLTAGFPTFPDDQRRLGYKKFIDFLDAAEQEQLVRITRVGDNRHPFVSPWDSAAATPVTREDPPREHQRVRGAVWPIVVDWEPSYVRLWDSVASRAFMYPAAEDGSPAWVSDPDRFVAVEPVTQEMQFEWMREFARSLPATETDQLLPTIGLNAARGAFRKVLTALGRDRAWASELQARVGDHVRRWAVRNEVNPGAVLERRRSPESRKASASAPQVVGAAPSVDGLQPAEQPTHDAPGGDIVSDLRARLHSVIDQMSATELSAIPIPAVYLIQK